MKDQSKFSRGLSLIAAAVVAVVTLAVLVPATHAVALGPNAATFAYNLAAGADSAPFTPIADKPIMVTGVQTNLGYRGVGFVSMLHITGSFLEWTGIESPASAAITSGFSGTAGTHIVYLDYSHLVDIKVASPDTFVVHNANTIAMAGSVTLVW
jgi:hypothetical protein